MKKKLMDSVYEKRKIIKQMGGEERIREHHDAGKLTARERIDLFLDSGSFVEVKPFMSEEEIENVITGYGTVGGKPVCVYSQDYTVNNGILSDYSAKKIVEIIDFAMKTGNPLVGFVEGEGLRDDVDSLKAYGKIMQKCSLASGVIPQINVIFGRCRLMYPFVGDFVIMTEQGLSYNVDPLIIKAVTGKEVSEEDIGGWRTSMNSGNCHVVAENDEETIKAVKQLLSFLPLNNLDDVPVVSSEDDPSRTTPEIYDIIPDDPFKIYDMRQLIQTIFDNGEFFEIQSAFAQNVITGFARIDERTAGVVANNPRFNVGCLDINSCNKISRFVRFCDAFNIPVLTFVDTGGFFPSVEEEKQGILRQCAKVFYSYSEATVPLITVIVRKAYGSAYAALGSKYVGADVVYAYPSAEIAMIDPETRVELEYGEEISKAENPAEKRRMLVEEIREKISPFDAASKGHVDDIIDPRFTRSKIIGALRIMETKRQKLPPKKHGNIPL